MKRILYILGVAGVLFSSCSKDGALPTKSDKALTIASQISTRASGTEWSDNDQIGVFASQGSEILGDNVPYSTALGGATGSFTADDEMIYFPQSGSMSITAYYPYVASTTLTAYAVNVANQTDPEAIDLMSASALSAKSSNAVPLLFDHRLSQINLTLKAGEGVTTSELTGAKVTVSGLTTDATYNLSTNEIALGSTVQKIDLNVSSDGLKATAIVVPQSASKALFIFTIPNFVESYTAVNLAEFESGKSHNFVVTISRDKATMESSTIESWVADSDTSDDNGSAIEAYTIAEIVASPPTENPWRIRTEDGNDGHTADEMDDLFEVLNSVSYKVDVIFVNAKSITSSNATAVRAINLRSVSAPVLTEVGANTFKYCTTLTTVSLPMATTIREWAFIYCFNLRTILLPKVTSIGFNTFYSCTALTTLSLPVATVINNLAFGNCTSLITLEIGTGLTAEPTSGIYITSSAFGGDPIATRINLTVGYGEVSADGKYWTPEAGGSRFGEFASVTKQTNP